MLIYLGSAALFILLALMSATLTVRDEGEWLAVRYGPLPVFRKRIRYANITSVEPYRIGERLYRLLGCDYYVKLTLVRKIIRVGSDDVENLVEFLRGKVVELRP